jgi:hypothetical protein
MVVRSVGAARGWQWIVEGFALFARSPLVWLALVAMAAVAAFLLSLLGRVGPLLLSLLVPGLMAGLLIGSRELDAGRPLRFGHLAAGFLYRGGLLVGIGGIYLVGTMLIGQLMIWLGGDDLIKLIELAGHASPPQEELQALFGKVAPVALTGTFLFLLLLMGTWYAPPLIVFHDLRVIEALRLSILGCLRNMLPMLVYGLVTYGMSMVAAFLLGALGPLLLIPVLLPSSYTSYKDIYENPASAEPVPGESGA